MSIHHPVRLVAPLALAAVLALGACQAPGLPAAAQAQAGTLQAQAKGQVGDIRKHAGVASRFLDQKRDVWVYLPPGYAAKSAEAKGKGQAEPRYPVLYMHDGNNVFDGSQAFGGHEWEADETAERLIKSGDLPPMIIVAVSNTSARMAEYTWVPGRLNGGDPVGGQGADYAKFLTTELKPLMDKTYRTKPGRADTGVMGSSLGGLISLYLARHEAGTFSKIGVMSPSVWWSDRAVLAEASKMPITLKLWLDMGHKEGNTAGEELENARELKRRLLARGYDEGKTLGYYEDREGGHNEQAWAYRLPLALKFLFGKPVK